LSNFFKAIFHYGGHLVGGQYNDVRQFWAHCDLHV